MGICFRGDGTLILTCTPTDDVSVGVGKAGRCDLWWLAVPPQRTRPGQASRRRAGPSCAPGKTLWRRRQAVAGLAAVPGAIPAAPRSPCTARFLAKSGVPLYGQKEALECTVRSSSSQPLHSSQRRKNRPTDESREAEIPGVASRTPVSSRARPEKWGTGSAPLLLSWPICAQAGGSGCSQALRRGLQKWVSQTRPATE